MPGAESRVDAMLSCAGWCCELYECGRGGAGRAKSNREGWWRKVHTKSFLKCKYHEKVPRN